MASVVNIDGDGQNEDDIWDDTGTDLDIACRTSKREEDQVFKVCVHTSPCLIRTLTCTCSPLTPDTVLPK